MKKIMFNEDFGLESAVLEGRKTMTRRLVSPSLYIGNGEYDISKAPFKVGDEVVIAQSYKDAGVDESRRIAKRVRLKSGVRVWEFKDITKSSGWTNKMFVKASLMPHAIRITDMRIERLQDITDEDCFAEGVGRYKEEKVSRTLTDGRVITETFVGYPVKGCKYIFDSPRNAFAHLIDKVSKKKTWIYNPLVFVYSFELVR